MDYYYKEVSPVDRTLVYGSTLGIQNEVDAKNEAVEPVLIDSNTNLMISARSALAVDLVSGKILYEKNSDQPLLPASTTKIITALVALDSYSPQEILTVGYINIEGQKMGLVTGEKIRAEDLIYGLLVESANDAAEVLAANYPGGREMFVAAMNIKVKELGLTRSLFVNPSGLDQDGQITTASDLIKASTLAMENPLFSNVVATRQKTVTSVDEKFVHKLTNVNKLLGSVDGVLGVKTGFTEGAQENLVTYVNRDGKKVMFAVLGSSDRFGETKALINWVFGSYSWVTSGS
jgi:D-alanyl-D-alanine carboxypeptidase